MSYNRMVELLQRSNREAPVVSLELDLKQLNLWASSSDGRTPDLHSGRRGFESHLCPQTEPIGKVENLPGR